jgi:hypothetical protein
LHRLYSIQGREIYLFDNIRSLEGSENVPTTST